MHPTLFRFGPIEVYSYGVMLMVGFIAAIFWARREAAKRGVDPNKIIDLALWILIFSLFFARVVFILLNLDFYRSQPLSELFLSGGRIAIQGLSFHGGLLGALLAGLIFARRAKISWRTLADICAPAVALGYGFGRIGCFLNGCCYGAPSTLPWATRFLLDPAGGNWTAPSHPTQLYAALGSWVIFGLLLRLRGRLPGRGQLFFAYLGLYSLLRFSVEFLRRGYSAQVLFDNFTYAQVASVGLFVASVVIIIMLRPKAAEAPVKKAALQSR